MVQVVNRRLRIILSKSKPTYEELLIVICEIKSVINSRPLCYVYDDSIEEVITHSQLFLDWRVLTKLVSEFNEYNIDCDTLNGFNRRCKLSVIGKRGHYFIIRPINKLYLLEIQNLDNSFVRNSSENDDVIDDSRANRPEQLAGERERDLDSTIE